MKFDDFQYEVHGPSEMADEEGMDYTADQVSGVFEDAREALETKLKEIDSRLELKGPR